jgi:hypothetical protein
VQCEVDARSCEVDARPPDLSERFHFVLVPEPPQRGRGAELGCEKQVQFANHRCAKHAKDTPNPALTEKQQATRVENRKRDKERSTKNKEVRLVLVSTLKLFSQCYLPVRVYINCSMSAHSGYGT